METIEWKRAFQVLEYVEAIHLREVYAEKEQVGRSMAGEKAQSLKRIIETDDLVALAPEDDLEDLARCRRDVQNYDPQLPFHILSFTPGLSHSSSAV